MRLFRILFKSYLIEQILMTFRSQFQDDGSAYHDVRQKTCSVTVHSDHTIVLSCEISDHCNDLIKQHKYSTNSFISNKNKSCKYCTLMTWRCVISRFSIGWPCVGDNGAVLWFVSWARTRSSLSDCCASQTWRGFWGLILGALSLLNWECHPTR